tara:strand:- start:117 stop:1238 length:1122 start_codon:yes stop_codon:yes gene_type:complete
MFIGCSSNITKNNLPLNESILIEKPNINYDTRILPKKINILFLDYKNNPEKDFVSGLLRNYYYFKDTINYSPEINLISFKFLLENNCSLKKESNNYSIIFLSKKFFRNLDPQCLNKILKLEGLIINENNNVKINKQNLTEFKLDLRSEYQDLLEYAINNGNINSLLIYENKTINEELIERIWLDLEGNVVLPSSSKNQSNKNLLSNILLIKNSEDRARNLRRILSIPLEFTPRRRMDIDSIILSVPIAKARSLKPELEYNFGETLSVYLFPSWDTESYYFDKELDLEKVFLVDLPWMFNSKIDYLKGPPEERRRFFAFGYDSYDIALLLSTVSGSRRFEYKALSGKLLFTNQILSRKSLKVEIKDGRFKSLGY